MTKKQIFWGGLLLMHLAAFLWAITHTVVLRDSNEYWNAAINFSKNGTFYCFDMEQPIDFRGFTKRPPLYPLFLWLVSKKWLVLLIQNGLSIFNIYLAFRIFTPSDLNFLSTRRFLLLCFITLFSFSQFIYTNLVMADLFLQTFTVLIVWLLIKSWEKLNGLRLLFLVGLVILALLTKPVVTFWIYFLPVFAIAISIFQKKTFKTYVLFFLISLLPLVVYEETSKQNEKTTGLKHYSSISDINLLHYNTRYLLINKYGSAEKADEILAPLMVATPNKIAYTENASAIRKACKDLILDNKWRYLKIHPGRFDLYQFLKIDSDDKSGLMEKSMKSDGGLVSYVKKQPIILLLALLLVFCFNLVKLFFFVRFTFNKQQNLATRIIILAAVLYFVGITGPIGASRFLLPVLPFFMLGVLGQGKTKIEAN
jgi:hypothetical protein